MIQRGCRFTLPARDYPISEWNLYTAGRPIGWGQRDHEPMKWRAVDRCFTLAHNEGGYVDHRTPSPDPKNPFTMSDALRRLVGTPHNVLCSGQEIGCSLYGPPIIWQALKYRRFKLKAQAVSERKDCSLIWEKNMNVIVEKWNRTSYKMKTSFSAPNH